MPRIPTYDSAPVQTRDYARPGGVFDDGAGARELSRGVQALGQGLGAVADQGVSIYKEAKAKADAIADAEADAEYQREETAALVGGSNRRQLIDDAFEEKGPSETLTPDNVKDTPGFYGTRGLEAGEKSAETLERLEKRRQEIAKKKFQNEEQRQRWLAKNGKTYEDTRRKVETHVSQQFEVAQADALKGRMSSTLDSLAADPYADPGALLEDGEAAIRSLQKSKEGGDAAVTQFKGDVSKTRIKSFLAAGDLDRAEQQYTADKGVLGTDGPAVKAEIDRLKKGREHDDKLAQDERDAAQIIANATPPGDYVDENRALAQLEQLPADVRPGVRTQLLGQLRLEAERQKNDIADWRRTAFTLYNQGGLKSIPGELLDRLNRYDPEFVHKLQQESELRWRRSRSDAREKRASDSAARREQADLNKIAWQTYMSMPLEQRAEVDINAEFLGSGADKIGVGALFVQQTRDKASLEKGQAVQEAAFLTDARAAGAGTYSTKKGSQEAKDFDAETHIAYDRFVEQHKRPPNGEESKKLIADTLLKRESTPGLINQITGGNVTVFDSDTPAWKVRAAERKAAAKKTPAAAAPRFNGVFEEGLDLTQPARMTDASGVLRERGADGKWRRVK